MEPIETPEQRKARQFVQLRQLGRYAMNLADRAHAQAERQIDAPPADKDGPAPQNHVATVASMSRAVRQTIAIEIRLDAPPRTRPGFRFSTVDRDPRRILLTRVFHAAISGDPEAPRRRREIIAHIHRHLESDPDQLEPMDETIAKLCNELDIDLDPARVPDELLNFAPPDPEPAQTPPPLPPSDRPPFRPPPGGADS